MIIKNVSLIARKQEDGTILMFGASDSKSLSITEEGEHLFIGDMKIDVNLKCNRYKNDFGNTPNEILINGGLNPLNYNHSSGVYKGQNVKIETLLDKKGSKTRNRYLNLKKELRNSKNISNEQKDKLIKKIIEIGNKYNF